MASHRPACVHFLRGSCRYGDACRFSHDEDAAQPPCAFFERGTCRNGDACLFAHVAAGGGQHTAGGARASSGAFSGAPQQQHRQQVSNEAMPAGTEQCVCSACGYDARSPRGLLRHLKSAHGQEPSLAATLEAQSCCASCGRTLRSFAGLCCHFEAVHLAPPQSRAPRVEPYYDSDGDYFGGYDDEYEERMDNFGFTYDEVNELLCQGVKPWEDDAFEVLEFLRDPY